MSSAIDNYTLPDVGGQRIELSPSVPEWVHELPVLNHPNDIRSLVRVVNMLGQEVDPNTQFKGEILLYLYNDGTTEKILLISVNHTYIFKSGAIAPLFYFKEFEFIFKNTIFED